MLTLEQYLATSFEGADREYVNGEIVERNWGEKNHSAVQAQLVFLLASLRARYSCRTHVEIRVRLSASIVRIPDVALFATEPEESVPTKPPLLVIEVVSPDDRHSAIVAKLEEYRRWGVPDIWLVDPHLRKMYVYGETGLHETATLELPAFDLRITPTQLFD